jgi:hypothetical protein
MRKMLRSAPVSEPKIEEIGLTRYITVRKEKNKRKLAKKLRCFARSAAAAKYVKRNL